MTGKLTNPGQVTVAPIYDGDPEAPDATPDLIGVRIAFTGEDAIWRATADMPLDAARDVAHRIEEVINGGTNQ